MAFHLLLDFQETSECLFYSDETALIYGEKSRT